MGAAHRSPRWMASCLLLLALVVFLPSQSAADVISEFQGRRRANRLNPGHFFCSAEIVDVADDKECGEPCPSGFDMDCPVGKRCYGPLPECTKMLSARFCGTSSADASAKCRRECPTGKDRECDLAAGERCWDDTTCTEEDMSESRREVPNPANHFCAPSYQEAVMRCDTDYFALQCPPATDEHGSQIQIYGCPMGQFCFGNLKCTPVPVRPGEEWKLTTTKPTAKPGTPTQPLWPSNPNRRYCYEKWIPDTYDGICGPPCPSGSDDQCPQGQYCYGPQRDCTDTYKYGDVATPNPTRPPTPWPTPIPVAPDTTPVPTYAPTPTPSSLEQSYTSPPIPPPPTRYPTPLPVNPPTRHPSRPPSRPPTQQPTVTIAESKRFCGIDLEDVTDNCLTAVPCPGGVAYGVCPSGMQCINDTPCADEAYLAWLRDQQAVSAGGQVSAESESSPSIDSRRCNSDQDCLARQFCNILDSREQGYCGECLLDGTGCSSSDVCGTTSGCVTQAQRGATRCYKRLELDKDCAIRFNDANARCIIDTMACEFQKQTTQQEGAVMAGSDTPIYNNPEGNHFFCGQSFSTVAENCLQSQPCPGGFSSIYCAENEGCFVVPGCADQYAFAAKPPAASAQTPQPTETIQQHTPSPSRPPIINLSTNFCGVSWEQHSKSCASSLPCPRGDECPTGQSCFHDSPCAENHVSKSNPATSDGDSSFAPNINADTIANDPSEPSITCNICGNSQLDWSKRVIYEDSDISCGEFGWIFLSANIREGSDQCLNFRAKYHDECCRPEVVGDGCDLCDAGPGGAWYDVQEHVDVEYGGETISCSDLWVRARDMYEPLSRQCLDLQGQHFSECCFQKCSLCGESNLNPDAIVFFSGSEVSCSELDGKIFVEEGVSFDSSICDMSRSFYSDVCCESGGVVPDVLATRAPTATPTTHKPTSEFNNWYGISMSGASSVAIAAGPLLCPLLVMGATFGLLK